MSITGNLNKQGTKGELPNEIKINALSKKTSLL